MADVKANQKALNTNFSFLYIWIAIDGLYD